MSSLHAAVSTSTQPAVLNLDVHIGMDQVQLMDNKVGFGQQSLKG